MNTAALTLADRSQPAIASLGSGSKGNGTLVQLGGELLLVDCGFGLRAVTQRLARLSLRPADLSAILVSHEHSDHMQGVASLAHRFNIPVYASHGTLRATAGKLFGRPFTSDEPFAINAVQVMPVTVPHDAREPTQFVFRANGASIGVLSDLGHVTAHVCRQYQGLDALLLEANHDRDMLAAGRYPASVKRRVGGDLGHLANEQALALLQQIAHPGLRVLLGHISGENNCMQRLAALFEPMREQLADLGYATQAQGHDWRAIDSVPVPAADAPIVVAEPAP